MKLLTTSKLNPGSGCGVVIYLMCFLTIVSCSSQRGVSETAERDILLSIENILTKSVDQHSDEIFNENVSHDLTSLIGRVEKLSLINRSRVISILSMECHKSAGARKYYSALYLHILLSPEYHALNTLLNIEDSNSKYNDAYKQIINDIPFTEK